MKTLLICDFDFKFVKKAFRGIITKMSGADEQKAGSSVERKRMRLDDNATIDNRVDVEMSPAYKVSFSAPK